LEGLTFLPYQADEEEIQHTSKVDFTIEAVENEAGGDICFTLQYCTRLYKRETMERFARHFINIIRDLVERPDIRSNDTVLQQGSFAFDAFVEEFYPILVKGGRVDIPGLCVFIARNRVSIISSVPPLLNELNKALSIFLTVPVFLFFKNVPCK